jgi:hypothetical protein
VGMSKILKFKKKEVLKMSRYYVIGKEVFNEGEIFGIHCNKNTAIQQAAQMEKSKNKFCCQTYVVMNQTEVNKSKIKLF